VRSGIGELSGLEIVDRELLAKVLEELQHERRRAHRQRHGAQGRNILAARGLVVGTVVRMEGETQVTVKIIETETTRVLARSPRCSRRQ